MARTTTPQPPAYPIESVDNALRLLLMFREQRTLRVADASRTLGVAPSTAHRLLAMLQYHGFVVQDPKSRAYRAGEALTDIGLAVVRNLDVRSLARPALQSLAAELGETVHLAVLEGTDVLILDSIEGTQTVRVGSRVGVRLPAHVTSVGKAILAHLPESELTALYPSENLPRQTARSISRRKTLLRSLAQVAKQGYALNDGESEDDLSAIGVAIITSSGVPTAAISVSVPRSRFDEHMVARAVPSLREAAARTAERL